MTREELHQLIALVQRQQTELDNLEVKAARGGTPRRLFEALSAFANRTGGGVLLFGLDEANDFSIVGVDDVHRLQEELTYLAAHEMDPPLRPEFIHRRIKRGLIYLQAVQKSTYLPSFDFAMSAI
jgi:ATP-dependent DNA helicase RecG